MKITIDLSGLDELPDEIDEYINNSMIEASHNAIDAQKIRNLSSKKTYKNHTWNLRNAPGAAVVRDGEIIDLYIPADSSHTQAKNKTENLIVYGKKPDNGVILADGMEYASFVSSKGFDVIDTGQIVLENELRQSLEK